MPRILVISSAAGETPKVTMDEEVGRELIDDPHIAAQIIERLAWGLDDAEVIELRARVNRGETRRQPPGTPTNVVELSERRDSYLDEAIGA